MLKIYIIKYIQMYLMHFNKLYKLKQDIAKSRNKKHFKLKNCFRHFISYSKNYKILSLNVGKISNEFHVPI